VPVIEVEDLRKSYRDVHALRGISLSVQAGQVFALLGPNGAGKTTTVEILEGFRDRDGGRVSVLGHDPARQERSLKQRIGIVLQSTSIDPYLTVAETIDMYRGYFPNPRPTGEVIEVVGLTEKRDARVAKLSGGQQRRLDVGIALSGDPELLFLDEPTTGFDPGARRNAWKMVENLSDLGKTILLTTHYMDEAQHLADDVAILSGGEIVAHGPPSSLVGREEAAAIIRFRMPADGDHLRELLAREVTVAGSMLEVRTADPTRILHDLTGWALNRGIALEDLSVARPSLEDVYLELTRDSASSGATE
jgi:ABC-2 type transport system ATP-binding protein